MPKFGIYNLLRNTIYIFGIGSSKIWMFSFVHLLHHSASPPAPGGRCNLATSVSPLHALFTMLEPRGWMINAQLIHAN